MKRTGTIAAILLLCAVAAPLVIAGLASVTPEQQLHGGLTLPEHPTLDHYRALFTDHAFQGPILMSLQVAALTTFLAVGLGALCAYALARLDFPGRRAILAVVLAASMFPQIAIVSPLYLALRSVGLIDTVPGLVLPYLTFAMPLAVWLLTGVFRALPVELEEAALIDGATRAQALWRVILPLAAPGLAATGIVTFIYCWNEFLFALSFTVTPERHTVPVAIAMFRGRYQVPWGEILAGSLVATAPVALLVLAFQRRIVSGMTTGAVKD